MKYVEIDERSGAVSWDEYFAYLRSAQSRFPPSLYSYAANWDHYSLDGNNSLHDAWLLGIQFAYRENELTLELLGARHDRKHAFRYVGTKGYAVNISVEYRGGDRDVLAHEFRIENELVVHEIVFHNSRSMLITCQDVFPRTEMLS